MQDSYPIHAASFLIADNVRKGNNDKALSIIKEVETHLLLDGRTGDLFYCLRMARQCRNLSDDQYLSFIVEFLDSKVSQNDALFGSRYSPMILEDLCEIADRASVHPNTLHFVYTQLIKIETAGPENAGNWQPSHQRALTGKAIDSARDRYEAQNLLFQTINGLPMH